MIYKIYVSREEGGGGHTSNENCVDASVQGHEGYIKQSKERLITEASNSTENIGTKRKTTKTRKQDWEEKNCIDISSDKLAKSYMGSIGHGYSRETLREKLNFFL